VRFFLAFLKVLSSAKIDPLLGLREESSMVFV